VLESQLSGNPVSGLTMHVMRAGPSKAGRWGGVACALLAAALVLSTQTAAPPGSHADAVPADVALPLAFERNLGQSDRAVDFVSRGRGYTLFVTPHEAVLRLRDAATPLRLRWLGAAAAPALTADRPLAGERHSFSGADASGWRRHIPAYGQVRYAGVYRGVDLLYYGARGQVEYDWMVAPGSDPAQIRMEVTGAAEVGIDAQGGLQLRAAEQTLTLPAPTIYQNTAAGKRSIAGGYQLYEHHQVGFWLGVYDPALPLIIDPVLMYSGFLGGAGAERAMRLAVDGNGNVYLTGQTASADFPVTAGAARVTNSGGSEAFVAKFDPAGALVYVTYLGGAGSERGNAVAVDAGGAAYVTGNTDSTNFPVTLSAEQHAYAGATDGFVAKLSPDGSNLVYSTYLGGSAQETANAIAVDSTGAAYVGGGTISANFPVTNGAVQTVFQSLPNDKGITEADAFVTRLSADGSTLLYSTYLGGKDGEAVFDLALAADSDAVVVGGTKSVNFPATAGAVRQGFQGFPEDGFVTRLSADGSALVFSSYFGGNGWDSINGVALDGAGNICLAGVSASSNLPVTPGAPQRNYGGGRSDGFVAAINAAGNTLLYTTYLGGSDVDQVNGVALGANGTLLVAGETSSADFPVTRALQGARQGGQDAFVARINSAGTALDWSSYWGGDGDDSAAAVVRGSSGKFYLAGTTASADFPVVDAVQTRYGGDSDAFLLALDDGTQTADIAITLHDRADPVPLNDSFIYDVNVVNNGPDSADGVSIRSDLPSDYSVVSATASQGSCSATGATLVCALGSMAAGASVQATLEMRAHTGGANALTVNVQRASQSDSNLANNVAREETTIAVGNGGGALELLSLVWLTLHLVARQRRNAEQPLST